MVIHKESFNVILRRTYFKQYYKNENLLFLLADYIELEKSFFEDVFLFEIDSYFEDDKNVDITGQAVRAEIFSSLETNPLLKYIHMINLNEVTFMIV